MSKELEEIKTLRGFNRVELNNDENVNKSLDIIEQALQRLESIDNAEPSEALECLESIEADLTGLPKHVTEYDDGFDSYLEDIWNNIDTIKQALQNAQKEHKALEIIKEKRIDIESFYSSFIERDFTYDFYASWYGSYGKYCLTEEEFNLLKGILEC